MGRGGGGRETDNGEWNLQWKQSMDNWEEILLS